MMGGTTAFISDFDLRTEQNRRLLVPDTAALGLFHFPAFQKIGDILLNTGGMTVYDAQQTDSFADGGFMGNIKEGQIAAAAYFYRLAAFRPPDMQMKVGKHSP
ncbi:hypothetical protein GCM10010911_29680 [Paenibacillus nasutitermitis]|uniref:Uncharacterized protein n=1 Tax=Paenibacillus nasutitermitis TaxID=1652958 RepID=A0A916Z204_9BACL|nr:hypothetical protein GCM10010911_29680 [Paenibacillus nasutitermitis]